MICQNVPPVTQLHIVCVSAMEAKIHQILATKRGQKRFAKGFLQEKAVANIARLPAKAC